MTITQLHLEAHANVAFNLDIPRASIGGYRGVMQIRQYPGAQGSPVVELPPVTVTGTGVQVVGGNTIRLRIEQATLDTIYQTYSVNLEAGRAIVFSYDLLLSPLGGEADIFYEGFFTLKGGVTRTGFLPSHNPPRIGIMGDSIMQTNHFSGGANNLGLHHHGEVAWAQARFPNFSIDTWYDVATATTFNGCNLARGGSTAGTGNDIAGELGERIGFLIGRSPDIMIYSAGTNNIRNGATAAATAAAIQANVQQALDVGIYVVLATVRPYDSTYSSANPLKKAAVADCNTLLRAWATGRAGVTLWDVFLDYDNGTGVAKTNFLYDTVHPSLRGAFFASARLATILKALTGSVTRKVPTGPNRIANPNMADTGPNGTAGAGVTGTVGSGWTIVRALGSSVVVAGHDAGGNQTIQITGAGATAERVRTGYESGGPSVTAGEWIQPTVTVELSGWAGWRNVSVQNDVFGGMMFQIPLVTDSMALGAPLRLTLISAPQFVQTTSAGLTFQLWFEIDGTVAGSGTATVIEKRLTVVPDPRPLHGVAV